MTAWPSPGDALAQLGVLALVCLYDQSEEGPVGA